jgi:hypothetical protein
VMTQMGFARGSTHPTRGRNRILKTKIGTIRNNSLLANEWR